MLRAYGFGWAFLLLSLSAVGCGGGGPYGFARTYVPLGPERRHYDDAQQPTYQDLVRNIDAHREIEIGWFGVVTGVQHLEDDVYSVTLSLRAHQARHLCADERASSCRVTVSEASLGSFIAELHLRDTQRSGPERVWVGSLLKVYGVATGDYDDDTGPVIDVRYFRHWPRGFYATTAERGSMRR